MYALISLSYPLECSRLSSFKLLHMLLTLSMSLFQRAESVVWFPATHNEDFGRIVPPSWRRGTCISFRQLSPAWHVIWHMWQINDVELINNLQAGNQISAVSTPSHTLSFSSKPTLPPHSSIKRSNILLVTLNQNLLIPFGISPPLHLLFLYNECHFYSALLHFDYAFMPTWSNLWITAVVSEMVTQVSDTINIPYDGKCHR